MALARALRVSDSIVIHLEQGTRYRASRPLAVEGLDVFPVSVVALGSGHNFPVTTSSSYEEAGGLVVKLNKVIKEAGFG